MSENSETGYVQIDFGDLNAYLRIKPGDNDAKLLKRMIQCAARELAPCTDTACQHCRHHRRPD
jgi:hypothetical protein